MCWFRVYSFLVRQSYASHSFPLNSSSPQMAPYIVITVILTVFPVLYLLPHDYFVTTNLCFLVPPPLPSSAPTNTVFLFDVHEVRGGWCLPVLWAFSGLSTGICDNLKQKQKRKESHLESSQSHRDQKAHHYLMCGFLSIPHSSNSS